MLSFLHDFTLSIPDTKGGVESLRFSWLSHSLFGSHCYKVNRYLLFALSLSSMDFIAWFIMLV